MSLTALTDDSLLMTVESKAFVEDITQMVYYRSSDRGRTWRTDTINSPTVPRRLVVEDDGSLLMGPLESLEGRGAQWPNWS